MRNISQKLLLKRLFRLKSNTSHQANFVTVQILSTGSSLYTFPKNWSIFIPGGHPGILVVKESCTQPGKSN